MSRELSRLLVVECETESSGGEQGLQRRTSNLLLVSMTVLDEVSLWLIGVADWLAESRCVKREVSRPTAADGYGHGSCDGQLLDADAEVIYTALHGRPAAYHRATGPPWG